MKQRILSILLALAMCLSLLPTAAFAVEPDEHDHSEPYCTCETACTEDNRNADCTVCSAEDAQLTDCAQYIAPAPEQTAEPESDAAIAAVQALIDALPTVETVTAEDYDAVQAAYDAYTALSAEQQQSILGADCFEDLFAWFNEQTAAVTTHTHCVCGGNGTELPSEAGHSCADITFTEWTYTDSLPIEAGNFYLSGDVTISGTWEPADGTVLCLNGHSITRSTGSNNMFGRVIYIHSGYTFTLTDCASTPGKITHATNKYGPGVYCDNANYDSTTNTTIPTIFHMYGGNITGNTSNCCGGVYCLGNFNLYGGSITNNRYYNTDISNNIYGGGGVYVPSNGQLNMYDGTISGNYSVNRGGGVYLYNNTKAFNMYGGTISDNTATHGGGVCLYSKGSFTMTGGTITSNKAIDYFCGGVCTDGEYVTCTVGGNASITGNIRKYYSSSVYNTDVPGNVALLGQPDGNQKPRPLRVQSDFTGTVGLCASDELYRVSAQVLTWADDGSGSFPGTFIYDTDEYTVNQTTGNLDCLHITTVVQDGKTICFYCGEAHDPHPFQIDYDPSYTYNTFANAYGASWDGDTITLLADYTLTSEDLAVTINHKLTLDLNGHTLSGGTLSSSNLTIINSNCQHSNITASGYCPDCNTQMKVKGTKGDNAYYFASLDAALNDNRDIFSFELLANCEESIRTGSGGNYSFELNGHNLTKLTVETNATITITDKADSGSIGTLDISSIMNGNQLCGGSYGTINLTNNSVISFAALLATGYAYEDANNTMLSLSAVDQTNTLTNVKVVACSTHSVGTDGKCEYCYSTFVATVTHGSETKSYVTFNEAYNAAVDGDTITLLANAVYRYDNSMGSACAWSKSFTVDLGGKTLSVMSGNSGGPLYINGGTITLKNGTMTNTIQMLYGDTVLNLGDNFTLTGNCDLQLYSNTTLNVTGTGVNVSELYVVDHDATCKLDGGTFGAIRIYQNTDNNGYTVGQLLSSGYGFKTDSGTWYDSTSTETKITNVTVQELPITGVSITNVDGTQQADGSYQNTYHTNGHVTYTITATDIGQFKYSCYIDGKADGVVWVTPSTNLYESFFNLSNLSIGQHTIYIEATKDGYTAKSGTVTVEITKATLNSDGNTYYAPEEISDLVYNCNPQELIEAGGSYYFDFESEGAPNFLYRVNDGEWSRNIPTATNAGTYTVDWYIDGGTNYNDVGSETSPAGTISVTIQGKMTVNISGTPTPLTYSGYSQYLLNEEWLGANVTVTAGGNTLSSDQYSLQYKLAEASNWAGAIPAATDVASYTVYIRVIPGGDSIGVYTESDAVTLTVEIGKGTHYVAWQGTNPMTVTYGDTDASVVYCGDPWHDGFQCTTSTLTYTVTDGTDVLEVDADTGALTIKKVGSATITATAAEGSNYNAGSASITVEVKAKTLTDSMIAATVKEFTYDGQPHTPTYTVKDGETTLIKDTDYTVSGSTSATNAQQALSYDLVIEGTGNYTGTARLQWYINKATLTQDSITANKTEFIYEPNTEQGPIFTVTVGGRDLTQDIDYSVDGVRKAFNAGEYTLTVTGLDPNYEGSATLTWKITPKTLAAEESPTVYTGLKYNGNAQLLIEKDGISDDQGGGEIVYSAAKDGEYGTFSALYDDQTSCFWGKVVRTYTIWWKVVPSTGDTRNWNDSEPQELTVSISKGDATAPTDRSAYAGSKLSDIPLPDDWTWVDGDQTLSGEGEQTYYANYAGDDNYNSASNVAVTVTVLPKEQRTLGVSMASWTYGDTANTPVYTKPEDATNLTVLYKAESAGNSAYTTTVPTDAGHYTVKVSYETVTEIYVGMANFSINEKNIEKAVITLSQDPTYNGQPQTPEIISVTLGGKSLTRDTDYTVDDCAQTNAGESYYLTIRGTGNYGSMANTSWNINKAPLTISSVTAADKEYDGNTNATITTVTFDGLVNSETLTKDVDYTVDEAYFTENANVRTDKYVSATITLTNSATATNYALSSSIATTQATIHQKPVNVTVTVEDKDYDGTNVATVTATVESGLIEGDSIAITGVTGTFDNANVGTDKTVTIDASGKSVSGSGFGNYYLKFPATAKGTIKAAALTITAKAHSITYGDAPVNNGVEYSGFVGGETERVLDGTLDYDYSYQQYGNVGSSYTITPKGLISGNYAIEFKSGTLTVAQKEVGIDWTHTADLIYTGSAQKPTATATGLVNGDSCTITVTGEQTNAGENYTATATGLSNSNYKLPEHVTTSFSIGKANAPTLMAYTTFQCYTIDTEQTVTVNLAAYGVPADANVTGVSAAGVSGKTEQFMTTQSTPTLDVNTMTAKYTISDATKSMVGGSATFSYTVQSQNYKDMTLNIVVTLADKVQKSLGVTMSGWTYGSYDETANAPVFTAPDGTTETKILYQWQSPTQSGGGSPTTTVPTTPGTYKVFVRCETATEIWNGTATFTISKAIVTITATDQRAYIGVSAPDLRNPVSGKDYTVTGLIGEDTLDVTIVLTCDANMNRTGTYDIVPSVTGEDSRYDFTFETGKLTVSEWPVIPSTGTTGKDPDSSTTASNSKKFNDVPTDAYFADAVAWASARNITGGVDETHFGPDLSCTRAQLVTFLWRAAGCPEPKAMNSFTDVAANAYYAKAVAWAAENGIVDGYGNGLFGSEDTITREQMAVILYRFAKATGMDTTQGGMAVREYSDFDQISDYAVSAMQWAVNAGILQGYDGKLMPQQPCTRAQIVTMLYRLLGE